MKTQSHTMKRMKDMKKSGAGFCNDSAIEPPFPGMPLSGFTQPTGDIDGKPRP